MAISTIGGSSSNGSAVSPGAPSGMGAIVGGALTSGDYGFTLPAGTHYLHASTGHLMKANGEIVFGTGFSPQNFNTYVATQATLFAGPTTLQYSTTDAYGGLGGWYLNGMYFLLNANNMLYTSPDGVTWTYRGVYAITSITYGNSIYVANASNGSTYYTSTDGINWTTRSGPASDTNSVAFGSGKFVWVAYQSLYTSTDGINWSYIRNWNSAGTWTRPNAPVIWSGTKFWFGADGTGGVGSVWRCNGDPSTSGNWTEYYYTNVDGNKTAVTAYNDNVVIVQVYGSSTQVRRSTNGGTNWTELGGSFLGWNASTYNAISRLSGAGVFSNGILAFGFNTTSGSTSNQAGTGFMYSTDGGATWSAKSANTGNGVSYLGNRCLFPAGNYVFALTSVGTPGRIFTFNSNMSNGTSAMALMSTAYKTLN